MNKKTTSNLKGFGNTCLLLITTMILLGLSKRANCLVVLPISTIHWISILSPPWLYHIVARWPFGPFSLLTFFYYPFGAQSKHQNKSLVPSRNFPHINHTPLHCIKNTSKVQAKNYGREKKRECDNGHQKSPICLLSLSLPTFSFLQTTLVFVINVTHIICEQCFYTSLSGINVNNLNSALTLIHA
jgi:hypothetical protein